MLGQTLRREGGRRPALTRASVQLERVPAALYGFVPCALKLASGDVLTGSGGSGRRGESGKTEIGALWQWLRCFRAEGDAVTRRKVQGRGLAARGVGDAEDSPCYLRGRG